jgi:hypothetical protein
MSVGKLVLRSTFAIDKHELLKHDNTIMNRLNSNEHGLRPLL